MFGAYSNLGLALKELSRFDEAESCFRKAIAINSDYAEAHSNLGLHLNALGRFEEAVSCYRQAIAINPDFAEAHFNLGNALKSLDMFDASTASYRQAISIRPDYAEAYANLGNVLKDTGQVDDALACYRDALVIEPSYAMARSNLLLALNYVSGVTQAEIEEESTAWERRISIGDRSHPVFDNDRTPERLLRVGFVSPDIRTHSVAYFFEPLLTAIDPSVIETFCYADVTNPDETTRRLRACAGNWRETASMIDSQLEEMIRSDGIDILVDLAGHTEDNRLQVFLRKPAPIQVTWLGYPNTTGLSAMDYRFVDAVTDPTDEGNEIPVRLQRGFLCYRPPDAAPPCRAVRTETPIRFGSFNNVAKMSAAGIALWSKILNEVPESVLVLKSRVFADATASEYIVHAFRQHGINSDRLDLLPFSASVTEHLEQYGDIDVCLDTLPYNGTTTTCEALWMGVPVVAMWGDHHRSRVGASILSRVGMEDCVASDADSYVEIAAMLARDVLRRAELREDLRDRMAGLCDAQAFARDMEVAMRTVWQKWCND